MVLVMSRLPIGVAAAACGTTPGEGKENQNRRATIPPSRAGITGNAR